MLFTFHTEVYFGILNILSSYIVSYYMVFTPSVADGGITRMYEVYNKNNWLTHCSHVKREEPTQYANSEEALTVKHVFLHCCNYADIRISLNIP